jgi:UDP-N-acetylmuramate--alanine ligase
VGAAGAGASAAALLASHAGAVASGCDSGGPSPYTPAVAAAGIRLVWAHDAAHVLGSDSEPAPHRLAVTKALTAVRPDHPELLAAHERGIPTEPWQQVVADAAVGRRLVAVAGTHGKSTTAAWLVHVLVDAGLDPAAFVGALLPGTVTGGQPATARWGRGPAFVVEADEYAGNFDPFLPDVAVVTNVDWDHPDVFADRASVETAFERWLRRAPEGAWLVVNADDAGASSLTRRLADRPHRIVPYRLAWPDGAADTDETEDAGALHGSIVHADASGTTLAVTGLGSGDVMSVRLPTAGRHNAANALAVAGAAHVLGVPAERIAAALATFPGAGRRLERKGDARGVVVYDDYGHHPNAIRATLEAVRQREPGRRVWVVYEPLTYHRTAALLDAFADALAEADGVAIADIWPGRDPDTTIASAIGLAQAVAGRRPGIPIEAPGDVEATAAWLAGSVQRGDAVVVMGGGRSYRIAELLLARLAGS